MDISIGPCQLEVISSFHALCTNRQCKKKKGWGFREKTFTHNGVFLPPGSDKRAKGNRERERERGSEPKKRRKIKQGQKTKNTWKKAKRVLRRHVRLMTDLIFP
jgi:hypothetical protein